METKLEGALVAGPLKKDRFLRLLLGLQDVKHEEKKILFICSCRNGREHLPVLRNYQPQKPADRKFFLLNLSLILNVLKLKFEVNL